MRTITRLCGRASRLGNVTPIDRRVIDGCNESSQKSELTRDERAGVDADVIRAHLGRAFEIASDKTVRGSDRHLQLAGGRWVPAEPGFDPANIKAHLTAIEIGTKIRQMMKK